MLAFTKNVLADALASSSTNSLANQLTSIQIKHNPITGIPRMHIQPLTLKADYKQFEILASALATTAFHYSSAAKNLVLNSLVETLIDDLIVVAVHLAQTGEIAFNYGDFAQKFVKSVVSSYTAGRFGASSAFSNNFVAGIAGEICGYLVQQALSGAYVNEINLKKALLSGALRSFYGGVYGTIVK